MGLFDKLMGEFVDVIEWQDGGDSVAHRFERHQNEIKMGAKLTVRPAKFAGQKWGIGDVEFEDKNFGITYLGANGIYSFKITDPSLIYTSLVNNKASLSRDSLAKTVKELALQPMANAFASSGLSIMDINKNLATLADQFRTLCNHEVSTYGIEVIKFKINGVNYPAEIKELMIEKSRLEYLNLDKYAKLSAAEAVKLAAENEAGGAGMGMGAGVGMGMGMSMGNMMSGLTSNANQGQGQSPQSGVTPPPLPQITSYFVAVNGVQQGPFRPEALKQMILSKQLTKESHVWKEGMAKWELAKNMVEMKEWFETSPPPLPPT